MVGHYHIGKNKDAVFVSDFVQGIAENLLKFVRPEDS